MNNGKFIDIDVAETGHALSLQPPPPPAPPRSPRKHPRYGNQGKNTISAIVGSFKSSVTKWCNENKLKFGWQSRFHDHVIRTDLEYDRIRNYIKNNPAKWADDKFYGQ